MPVVYVRDKPAKVQKWKMIKKSQEDRDCVPVCQWREAKIMLGNYCVLLCSNSYEINYSERWYQGNEYLCYKCYHYFFL